MSRLRVGANSEHDEDRDSECQQHGDDTELPNRPAFGEHQFAAGTCLHIRHDEILAAHIKASSQATIFYRLTFF